MITATVLEKESSLRDWDGSPMPVIQLGGEIEDAPLAEWIGTPLTERDLERSAKLDHRSWLIRS